MSNAFDRPVYIRDGAMTVVIHNIPHALAVMDKWPKQYRGVVYDTVRWGLHAARQGQMTVETARKGLEGWARAHRILAQVPSSYTVESPGTRQKQDQMVAIKTRGAEAAHN